MNVLLWGLITICLLSAWVMDCRTRLVYNFLWWISGTAALGLLVLNRPLPSLTQWMELLVFISLQLFLFSRLYGRADCYAFCVCAMAEKAVGLTFLDYLIHMMLAFLLLALVQGMRHNIDRGGNLKEPVPFLPYITLAFWTLLWYHNIC